jgi:hypothetical protein
MVIEILCSNLEHHQLLDTFTSHNIADVDLH